MLTFKRRQKILRKRPFGNRCQSVRLYPMCCQPRNRRACARRTCAYDRTHKSRKVPPCQRRRNKDGVRMYGRQRKPAQKKRPRRIFIQSHQKFALWKIFPSMNRRASVKSQQLRNCAARCRLSRRQRKHRTFGISSRPAHGRRVPLNLLTAAHRAYPGYPLPAAPAPLPEAPLPR